MSINAADKSELMKRMQMNLTFDVRDLYGCMDINVKRASVSGGRLYSVPRLDPFHIHAMLLASRTSWFHGLCV